MANAQAAVPAGAASNLSNPAALALAPGLGIDIGYLWTTSNLTLDGADTRVAENRGLTGALVIPGDIGPVRLALGMAVYLPNAYVSRIRAIPQSQPRFALFDNRTQHLVIAANIAVRPIPELALGAGLSFLADTQGGVALQGTFYPEANRTELSTSVDVDFLTVRAPRIGIHWQPDPTLALALVWHGTISAALDLGATVDGLIAELLGPEPIPGRLKVRSDNANFFTPHRVVLGVAFTPTPDWLFAMDIAWEKWSDFPAPTAAIDVDFTLEGFDTANLIPTPDPVLPPRFSDIFTVRLGTEHSWELLDALGVRARLGYAFEPSPAPDQPGVTNYADCDKHSVAAGLGLGLWPTTSSGARPVELDVAAHHMWLIERRYEKSSPVDVVGDYDARGSIWAISATARFSWGTW